MFSRIPISDILLTGILIFLPASIRITNYFLLLLALLFVLTLNRSKLRKLTSAQVRTPLLISILPFLYIILSLTYSSDVPRGWKAIETYLPLLAFPIIFSTLETRNRPVFFLRAFACVILAMCVICTTYALYNFFFLPEGNQLTVGDSYSAVHSRWNALSNTSLMEPFDISPIYMSLYVSFALFICVTEQSIKTSWKIVLVAILIVFQLLASSRIGIAALLLSGCASIFIFREKLRAYYKPIAVVFVITVTSLVLLVFYNPVLEKRLMGDLSKFDIPEDVSGWNGINIRTAVWTCSIQLFKESPVIGYGTGSLSEVRQACYKNYSFYGPFGDDLNCHNQYFDFGLTGGACLLILFLGLLGYSFWDGMKKQSPLQMIFVMLFIITCLGESLIETHKGVVFFCFFNSLFLFRTQSGEMKI